MSQLKHLGARLSSRELCRLVADNYVRAAIVNSLTVLGMPQSVRGGQSAPSE